MSAHKANCVNHSWLIFPVDYLDSFISTAKIVYNIIQCHCYSYTHLTLLRNLSRQVLVNFGLTKEEAYLYDHILHTTSKEEASKIKSN